MSYDPVKYIAQDNQAQRERAEHPEALTEAYHKARKQFGLFSGLLIAWELIGVDLENFAPYEVKLKNPEAAPFVLLALVVYFAIRTGIEWHQCDEERRRRQVSRLDLALSYGLGAMSVFLCVLQDVLGIQVAELLLVLQFIGPTGFFWGLGGFHLARVVKSGDYWGPAVVVMALAWLVTLATTCWVAWLMGLRHVLYLAVSLLLGTCAVPVLNSSLALRFGYWMRS